MDERQLGADHRQIRTKFFRDGDQALRVARIYGKTVRFVRDAAVAGCAPDLFDARAFAKLPNQSVFASAAADNEYFHEGAKAPSRGDAPRKNAHSTIDGARRSVKKSTREVRQQKPRPSSRADGGSAAWALRGWRVEAITPG